jgi:hypothetical protein
MKLKEFGGIEALQPGDLIAVTRYLAVHSYYEGRNIIEVVTEDGSIDVIGESAIVDVVVKSNTEY